MGEGLVWTNERRVLERDCHIFKVSTIHRVARDGREGDFVEIDSPDWVTMIPVFVGTDGVERFVMERQFRHGAEKVTIEFPAGLVERNEDPVDAARRELLEETGAICGKCTLMGRVCPNSAFMNNHSNFFLMEDLQLVGSQNLDDNEEIDVITIPVDQAIRLMGTRQFDNGMMMLALGFYLRSKVTGCI
ncbi:MAG: NUDIX hydrolase [Sphaerochaetaceae bacterium]|nr:NUDIX hydrolase [Sphaerochaetaceae bacterium]